MLNNGYDEKTANWFTQSTCAEITPIGCSGVSITSPYINTLKIFLDAFNKCDNSMSFEDIYKVFEEEFLYFCKDALLSENYYQLERKRNGTDPVRMSAFVNDCIERGMSAESGGAIYNDIEPDMLGMVNVIESLNVIKEIVFNQQRLTIDELKEILNNNLSKGDVELEQIEKFQKINSINIENDYIYIVYNVVPKLWGSIACLIFIYNLLVYKIYIFKLNLIEEKNLKIEELLNIQKNKMNINKNIKYAFSDKITTPITIGIINKKIIIPKSFEINDYKYILKHEIFHIKNKDVEFKFFCVVLESIYFFNPIVKYLTKLINEIIELNCDYNILLNENNLFRKEYGNVLLRQIESRKEAQYKLIMSFASPRRKIMERFKNIIDEGARKKCFTILGVMSCLIIISLIVLAFIPNINVATTEKNNIATPVLTEYKSSNDLEYVNELNTEIKENVKNEFETNKIEKNEIKSGVDLNSEEIKDNQNNIKSDKDIKLFGPVPYKSEQWKLIYKDRTCTERINTRILNDYKFTDCRMHGRKRNFFMLVMIGINIHLDAYNKVSSM